MATILKQNSAEGGTNGTTVTTGNSGGASGDAFDAVSIGASNGLTFTTASPWRGSVSLSWVKASVNQNFAGWTWTGAQSDFSFLIGFRYPSANLAGDEPIIRLYSGTGYTPQVGAVSLLNGVNHRLRVSDNVGAINVDSAGVTMANSTDYVIVGRWQSGTTLAATLYAKGSGMIISSISVAVPANSINSVRVGLTGSVNSAVTMIMDDVQIGYGGLLTRTDYTPNTPPTISADLATAHAGDVVTLTVGDVDGTITDVSISGATPAPTVTGTGGTRTFIAPIMANDSTITATVTDSGSATASTTMTIKQAPARVFHNGAWRNSYPVVNSITLTGPTLTTTGLILRYRADSIPGVDLAAVSSWPSALVGGPAAVQATAANQPKLRTNAINGHQAVEFDGVNDMLALQSTALSTVRNRNNLIVFVVYKLPGTGVTGARTLIAFSTTQTATRLALSQNSSANVHQASGRRLDTDPFGSAAAATGSTLGELAILTGRWLYSTSDLYLLKDNVQIAANTAFQTDGSTLDADSLTAYIGANASGTAEWFSGMIAEVLVYDAADTDGSLRTNVDTYLSTIYNVT